MLEYNVVIHGLKYKSISWSIDTSVDDPLPEKDYGMDGWTENCQVIAVTPPPMLCSKG